MPPEAASDVCDGVAVPWCLVQSPTLKACPEGASTSRMMLRSVHAAMDRIKTFARRAMSIVLDQSARRWCLCDDIN